LPKNRNKTAFFATQIAATASNPLKSGKGGKTMQVCR